MRDLLLCVTLMLTGLVTVKCYQNYKVNQVQAEQIEVLEEQVESFNDILKSLCPVAGEDIDLGEF